MTLRDKDISKYAPFTYNLLVSVIYGIGVAYMVYMMDDLLYLAFYREWWLGDASAPSPLGDYINFFTTFRHEVNGRMADLALPLTLYAMPRAVFGVVTAAMIMCILYLCSRFINTHGRCNPWLSVLATSLLMLATPWHSVLNGYCFVTNYIWGLALVLCVTYIILANKRIHGIVQWTAVLLLCLLAGAWHEGLSAMMCISLASWAIYKRLHLSPSQWICSATFALGAITTLLTPALWNRQAVTLGDSLYRGLLCALPMFIFLAWWLLHLYSKRPTSRSESNVILWFIASFILCNLTFTICTFTGTRIVWWGDVMAIIGCFLLYNNTTKAHSGRTLKVITACLALFVVVQGSAIAYEQYRISKIEQQIRQDYTQSPDGIVFNEMPQYSFGNAWLMGRPAYNALDYSRHNYRLLYAPDKPELSLIPADLRNLPPEMIRPNSPILINGHIVTSTLDNRDERMIFNRSLVLASGDTIECMVEYSPFNIGNDTVYYVRPYFKTTLLFDSVSQIIE